MKLTQLSSFAYSPKNRYLRITKDEHYSQDQHYLTNVQVGVFAECPLHYGLKIALHNKIFLPKHTLFENK